LKQGYQHQTGKDFDLRLSLLSAFATIKGQNTLRDQKVLKVVRDPKRQKKKGVEEAFARASFLS